MTPDSTPLIGATRCSNLFLNTGHGTLGWTMACGSARVVADLVMGRSADIRTDDLGLHRYESPGQGRLAMLPPYPTAMDHRRRSLHMAGLAGLAGLGGGMGSSSGQFFSTAPTPLR
jgi:hypothetical protein